ncbi:UDP-forming cellulose synthase catalytic subunit [Pseudomonas helleri]|uniref:Cellulose synthase catalytic subunit [UDP-forming] n=1 Tax=Pseudomonas helleri TaxID=1608996 RepID=A0A6A7YWL0_9PSED|nr:UDP-forming cellulose synthase catalytic subunit [Pseudomonas helleri]MQT79679.1 UDP-forming cellulose synthase catalytic subunit [Pseudomonas helleri]MQU26313.1 UDP-forming cellulose synthase catalytic subunit [Pseudomonas helleri]
MIEQCFPYKKLREEQNCTRITAFFLASMQALGWLFLRFESPCWQTVRAQRRRLYPHLADKPASFGDPLRYLIQTVWLLLVRVEAPERGRRSWIREHLQNVRARVHALCEKLGTTFDRLPVAIAPQVNNSSRWWDGLRKPVRNLLYVVIGVLATVLMLVCMTEPFDYVAQSVFVILLWGIALLIRRLPGHFPTLLLISLSVIVSCRYLWWRYTSTLNWNNTLDLVCGLTLLMAETYAWLVLMLGYLQTSWPLKRKPAALPADTRQWPSVDLLIPTYNESLSVVRATVYAAIGIDWPKDKLRIHLLDDGRRADFKAFAQDAGIHYITRADNRHAKAGNLNHALTLIKGELVAIFDCDHIPARSFLQVTTGWFLRDPKLALVQTPHHFLSPDPLERNLGTFGKQPNEGELFYGLVQDGNDVWNAAFFCGSCAILRRSALESIGGFAVETVTEDAHTALRLHRKGWNSAYLRIPQAAGLATESLSAHIAQRMRWARGMVQIFRTDNPLFGKGLTVFQRICYANAMLHFLLGLPRIVFLTAPLAFLLLHAYIIYAPALMIVLYVLPHMIHAILANYRLQSPYRQTLWGEIYETVVAWHIARPTTVALFSPSRGTFNVTVKGGRIEQEHFDWKTARPYLLLSALNVLGLGFAAWRLLTGPENEILTVVVSVVWVIYNLLIIGVAVAVAAESRQLRHNHRVQTRLPGAIKLANGHCYPCELMDYSLGGVGLQLSQPLQLPIGTQISLMLMRGHREFVFSASVTRCNDLFAGLSLTHMSHAQRIEFVQCTFGRADAWLDHNSGFQADKPIKSLRQILTLGVDGYRRLYRYLPAGVHATVRPLWRVFQWLGSYLPRMPLPPLTRTASRS